VCTTYFFTANFAGKHCLRIVHTVEIHNVSSPDANYKNMFTHFIFEWKMSTVVEGGGERAAWGETWGLFDKSVH
jgi:hypothetical protein